MRGDSRVRGPRLLFALCGLLAPPLASACSGGADGVVAPADAAARGDAEVNDAGAPKSDAAFKCANLDNDAPPSPFVYNPGPAPAPTGGSVADGVYSLTRTTEYGTDGGTPFADKKETRRFAVDAMDQVYAQTSAPDKHRSATFSTSGQSITFRFYCTEVFENTQSYSATSTAISLYYGTGPAVLVETFTRR